MGNGNILDLEKSLREKLSYLSIHEELTGVYNFRYFQEQLDRELAQYERHHHPLCLAIFDIDDFKKYSRYSAKKGADSNQSLFLFFC